MSSSRMMQNNYEEYNMTGHAQKILLDESAIALFEMRADELISKNSTSEILLFINAIQNPDFTFENKTIEARYFYTIANCQSVVFNKNNEAWYSEELGKSVINYRKALYALQGLDNNNNFIINLKSRIETNLGNYLFSQGRLLCCKNHWEIATTLDNNPVATIRKAYNNILLAGFLYDEGHSYYHYYKAYKAICTGMKEVDLLEPDIASAYIESGELLKFKNWFETNFQESDFDLIDNYKEKFKSKKQHNYLKWCGNNKLFLNELNDEYMTELVYTDCITLPSHTTIINQTLTMSEDLVYHGNFEEIKNDYIYARYLIFSVHTIPNNTDHFYNNTYQHIDDMSYAITNIKAQHYKTAFKTLYSLFDKIAYFLNSFYDFNNFDARIYFHTFFGKLENGRLKPHSKLKESKNPFLHALFYILKDIRDSSKKGYDLDSESFWLDPDAESFSEIRNAIEHRSLKIIDDFGNTLLKRENDIHHKYFEEEKEKLYILEEEILKNSNRIKECKIENDEEKLKKLFTQSEETMSKITASKLKINEKLKRKNHSLLISESDFESRLFLLMKLVRRSIIYLSLAVHWEQKQKRDDSPLIIPREVPLKHKIDF